MSAKRIAIACQGGGTHAAFTWGVLTTILETKRRWDATPDSGERFDIVSLSGTSAGALCALAAWYGLIPNSADAQCGTPEKAIERLDFLWNTFAATSPVEHAHNTLVGSLLNLKEKGLPSPSLNPYDIYGKLALNGLAAFGARDEYLGFGPLLRALCPDFEAVDWPRLAERDVRLLVGAIEVLSGNFEAFDSDKTLEDMGLLARMRDEDQYRSSRWRMRRAISLEGVAASGTLPEVLPAQEIPNTVFPTCEPGVTVTRSGYYWDGLYSQNPPVRELLDERATGSKPDEIWVIRINSQESRPRNMTVSLADIRDRENELAGNVSLNQELDHILGVNRWIRAFGTDHPPLKGLKIVDVRTIKMTRDTAFSLRHTSKFDRDPDHFARLREEGRSVAGQWLAERREQGADFQRYPDDARYPDPLGGSAKP